ncbi:hypothetical protein LCGC14_0326420 [marine sediment metagenome]|uniref:PseI/NeuA/B-like domain-containing protein n=1 Tax=marine sediment metagenome TaxID=412755 RepID=A0A0F9TI05_9ZZZZ
MLICAEIGINHNGDWNLCRELIRQAANAGADLAKFQLYDPEDVFADEPELIPEGKRCAISRSVFDQILGWCEEENIEPFFSVFDDERFGWTESAGIGRYKLASRTLKKTPDFARKVIGTGKSVYASLGMIDAEKADGLLGKWANVHYLFCVPAYPATYADYLSQPRHYPHTSYFGISDHSPGIGVSLAAIGRGAGFVEKHFTLDKTLPGSDHICSITPNELAALVYYGRQIEKAIWAEAPPIIRGYPKWKHQVPASPAACFP